MGHLNAKDIRKKEYRKLEKELDDLRHLDRNLGYKPLKNPIRHGWFLEIVFSLKLKEISKYKELWEFLNSRERLNTLWGKDKKSANDSFQDRCNYYEGVNSSLVLSRKEFNRLSENSQSLCVPFKVKIWHPYKNRFISHLYFRAKIPPKYIKRKYIKCYITKQKVIDPNLTSRIDEIINIMYSQYYDLSYFSNNDWRDWDDYNFRKRRGNLKRDLEDLLIKADP